MNRRALADWLAALDDDALAELLDRRPDVVLGGSPATLGELAERLAHPESIVAALRGIPLPHLQVIEALQALGERRTRSQLAQLLAGDRGPEHEHAVDGVLVTLSAAALVWPGDGDRLEVPVGLGDVLSAPLGLGPPLREVWAEQYADAIGSALRVLGGRPGGRKADMLEDLVTRLADADVVRSRLAQAPSQVAASLRQQAWAGADDDEFAVDTLDPEAYRERTTAQRWGLEHGLLAGSAYGYDARMPAEVALALRGPAYQAPFDPHPPDVATREVTPEVVASAAAAAAAGFAMNTLALLDRVARSPIALLNSGAIGVRELGRLAKELGSEEVDVRLILELAAAGGLLEPGPDGLGVAARFGAWRQTEPAGQVASLLAGWWAHPTAPTEARDGDGKALPALRWRERCGGCQAARVVLLRTAATLPPGTAAALPDLAAAARWSRPLVHVIPQDAGAPLITVWREAELLGALAAGALSPLGAALLADDIAAAHDHLRRMLPEASDEAVFGSDLTVLVAGSPSARITELLDSCADRESSGGATTWRLSPASVRRALDDGIAAEALIAGLAAISVRDLPQPLTFLINDVARRHGGLQVRSAVSLIHSDDEALLAEVAADRRLSKLGLHQVAPTVLSCGVPLETALMRLRQVGYFPVPAGDGGVARPTGEASARDRAADRRTGGSPPRPRGRAVNRPAPPPVDTDVLAHQLLAGADAGLPEPGSALARELSRLARGLTHSEIERLAHALEDGGRVRIAYRSASGATTRRVICDPEFVDGMLYAWCELRQDERVFTVARILSISAVGRPAEP